MSVPEQVPYKEYRATGSSNTFEITFYLPDPKDLVVMVNKEIPLVGAYSIVGDSVVFSTPPNEGDLVELTRDTQLDRETNFKSYDNSFRPETINFDLDKIWLVLQESNLVDAKILARLKQEIEWRRTHDFNYDELAQVREKQLFDALKGYTDTLNAATNPGVFQGVIAGVVFARDGKSIQTHLEEILEALAQERENIDSKADKQYVDDQLGLKADQATTYSKTEVDSALDQKASKVDTYTKAEVDTTFSSFAGGRKGFTTLALAQAAQSTLPADTVVDVTNDPTPTNNGTYQWNGTTLTKSAYDPLAQAKSYVDSETKITFPNKLINGDFTKGITNWGFLNSTIANVSSDLEITLTGTAFNGYARQTAIPTVTGNKYLIKARFKVDNSVCQKVEIGSSSNFGAEGYITVNNPTADEWIEISEIRTAAATTSIFYLIHAYADAATAANKKLTVDYVSLIDLTSSFPEGVPSKEILDKIFTGSEPYSVTPKDLIADYINPETSVTADDVALIMQDDRKKHGEVDLLKEATRMQGAVNFYGQILTTSSYTYTGFLDVSMFNKLKLSGFNLDLTYAFYDENKSLISVTTGTASNYVRNGEILVPKKAKYFARSLKTSTAENYTAISIVGIYAKDKMAALANEPDVLKYSSVDRDEVVRVSLMTELTKQQGEVTENGVINETVDYQFSGYLDVSDYEGVILSGFTSVLLTRLWFDENKQLIQKFDFSLNNANYILNGYYAKPKTAKYFAANLKNPTATETLGVIQGERQLNTSDFQRKGSSGDASQGWETTETAMRTQKAIEIFNPLYPDVKPLRIVNYGKQPGYDYGSRINFDTEIFRQGWGLQIQMNLTKPNAPHNLYSVKNLQNENGLLAEWGVEGFSWHVCPPGSAWGERAWMMFKLGGHNVRSNTNFAFRNASMAQFFAPVWSERTDQAGGTGWVENSADKVIDDTIPTRVMLRQSAHFNSPEYFRVSYSNQAKSGWDHFVRTRGSYGAPTAAQHGDSIHKQVFSVATGADVQGNPVTKEVAQIEIVYNDDASPESAKIVFKVWNKVTEAWEEKLVL